MLRSAKTLLLGKRLRPLQFAGYKTEGHVFGYNEDFESSAKSTRQKRVMRKVPKTSLCFNSLLNAYREHGHLFSAVNPIADQHEDVEREWVLNPERHGLSDQESVTEIQNIKMNSGSDVKAFADSLNNIYCGSITVEISHMMDLDEREWFCEEFERIVQTSLSAQEMTDAAVLMKKSEIFDEFLANRFSTTKRYGGEGAEAMMAFFNKTFEMSARTGVEKVVMCMPHRGRLNLLATLLDLPAANIFQKIKGMREWPEGVRGCGDVLSHLSNNTTIKYQDGEVYVTMIPNPSHLEANNPVAAGKTRAKQRTSDSGAYSSQPTSLSNIYNVMCLQVHGDASFSGQGIVPETLGLSGVPHYNVGGSVHLIVNNQLGFTTEAERGRTSEYASCIGKMNSIPIIRVNGEDPEAVMKAAMVAISYRNEYHKDVIVDMMCYRRWGHNELDNPSFTQPKMYKTINSKPRLPDAFLRSLVDSNQCSIDDVREPLNTWRSYLQSQFEQISTHKPKANHLERLWSGYEQAGDNLTTWDTGVGKELLRFLAAKSVTVPSHIEVHPTLVKSHVQRRLERAELGTDLDWATAESLAFGSLLTQGYDVRISGQDVGRGTFSHRHVMLVDQQTDNMYIPLNHMYDEQKNFIEVCNSTLSEEAVLGFEYGFSIESPRCLPIWEAQFGDFFNGAQIIIDTYISSAEAKWLLQSGLVMLLPHGMDGAGPEHSSCRVERFLQQTDSSETSIDGDSVNFSVVNPTTPAQYFHLLRRQVVRNFRKPLIVAAPKTLLRLAAATSTLNEMSPGTTFQPVLADTSVTAKQVRKVVFCSGKHYYTMDAERSKRNIKDVALVRVEELCPFPAEQLQNVIESYAQAKEFIWAQEEHRNAGAWTFVNPRFRNLVGVDLKYAGRPSLAQPATGIGLVHQLECKDILEQVFL